MKNGIGLIIAAAAYWMMSSDSWMSIVWFLGVVVAVTPVAVYFGILHSLPEKFDVSHASIPEIGTKLQGIMREYEELGFERAPGPWRFHLPNEAMVMVMRHPSEPMIATLFRIEGDQSKVGYDVVSMLDTHEGSLTTGMDHGAGVLPAATGQLRQIQQDASPSELVHLHRTALTALGRMHLPALEVAPSAILGLIRRSFAVNRETFLKSRAWNTLVGIVRTMRKTNPHMMPLVEQPGIREQVAKLPRSPRGRPQRSTARV